MFIIVNTAIAPDEKILYFSHSWSWALLEKPRVVPILKNFQTFYGT
jgi:hypothetical protein